MFLNNEILVSIITVTFNSEKTISRTIESVLNQTYKNIEYIVVDGMSTDNTINIIESYRDFFNGKMKYISDKDYGIYDAMNKGIDLATGKIIGIINSDDFYEIDAVQKVVEKYEGQEFAVFYGKMRYIGQDGIEKGIGFVTHQNLENEMICHPSCFITRKTYDKFGKFDLQYKYVADYDLMLRYKRAEVEFIVIDDILSNFSVGGISSTVEAYSDLLKMQVNYGKKSKTSAMIDRAKSYLSKYLHMK